MIGKIGGVARALAFLLAIVAGFVTIPNVDTTLVLVVLGLIGGLTVTADRSTAIILAALVLPVVASTLGHLPAVGSQLSAIATGLGLVAAASVATWLSIRMVMVIKADLMGLTK